MANGKSIELGEVRKLIVEAIRKKYNMTVGQFSESEYPEKLGIHSGNTLRCYLQGKGTSFETLKVLCKHFKVGTFEKVTEVIKTTKYFLEPTVIVPRGSAPATASGGKKILKKATKLPEPVQEAPKKKLLKKRA